VAALRSGQLDLHTHIDAICDRIEAVDGPVQALLPETKRRARLHTEAAALLARYPLPETRPLLYGALVGVKDIFHVDGFVTRAGSQLPPEEFAGAEAHCVQQLRQAGALVLGKTVTTEFAYFEPGPTRNPHNLAHTPGGSSSGSAAAVAAGLCPLGLGTQTIGSVIRPAAFCGVVGFKPTYDRIATSGLVYFSRTADHVGLFTQDVAGMMLAATVLCKDWQLATGDWSRASGEWGSKPVLGVPVGPYLEQTEPGALASFEQQLQQLEGAGYRVKRVPTLPDIQALNLLHRRMVFAEFAREHVHLYPRYADRYRPRTREIIQTGQTVSAEGLTASRQHCQTLRAELHAQMEAEQIDLWVCPPALGAAPAGIHATGDPNMNLPWTHAGMPALTLPAGCAADGMPLGLQLVGRFGGDEQLLVWANQLAERLGKTMPAT
jgi:Asp-tRNA(Asn)/Glu-tRNA(Gln) amidotransferase A subunit family amidase